MNPDLTESQRARHLAQELAEGKIQRRKEIKINLDGKPKEQEEENDNDDIESHDTRPDKGKDQTKT